MSGTEEALKQRRVAARRGCTRWLLGHGDVTPSAWLTELGAAATEDGLDWYGEGGEVTALESEVAELLGKDAAVLMPSGIMAQQAALRAWADRSSTDAVAVHGMSHLVVHELDALPELHGLRLQRLTGEPRPAPSADLDALTDPLAAVTIELPLRDAGYLLPTWDDLVAFSARCTQRGVPLHLDGARIWETQPTYDRSLAEIAALADSVYVSFYKGLGGMAGAILAGPTDLVAEARRWQGRHGGNGSSCCSPTPWARATACAAGPPRCPTTSREPGTSPWVCRASTACASSRNRRTPTPSGCSSTCRTSTWSRPGSGSRSSARSRSCSGGTPPTCPVGR